MGVQEQAISTRRARVQQADDVPYILAFGAPEHYVSGFGLISGGALFTMPPDAAPSDWALALTGEEYEKALSDDRFAAELAAKAYEDAVPKVEKRSRAAAEANASGSNMEASALREQLRKQAGDLAAESARVIALQTEVDALKAELEKAKADLEAAKNPKK